MAPNDAFQKANAIFQQGGGILRMSEAVRRGVSRRTLYAMYDAGKLERLSRGIYRLASSPSLQDPDLVTVSLRIPRGVICLISALAFHELTTQVPHAVDVALRQGSTPPRVQ
ncbi:MAG: type IV toxin-antitoxin system AbiEi family antitoxin domain-containing protein, partial [Dehalococcoidia bacterium]